MKKNIILFVAVLLFPFASFCQCKFKSSGPFFSILEKRTDIAPKTITKPKVIFDKFSVAAAQFFIKTQDNKEFFGFSFFRSYSSKFEVLDNNSLVLNLVGGENIELFPTTNYEGKRPGLSVAHFQIIPVYNISRQQIQKISENEIANVRFYITAETEITNTEIDDKGRYFDFEINAEKFKNNFRNSANCFLEEYK